MEIYAVRNTDTGKLVTNLTSDGKRFWLRKASALEAVRRAKSRRWYRNEPYELVTFKLVEKENDTTHSA